MHFLRRLARVLGFRPRACRCAECRERRRQRNQPRPLIPSRSILSEMAERTETPILHVWRAEVGPSGPFLREDAQ